jgi:hypothetical protein
MRAYVVFTRIRTWDPRNSLKTAQAPAFVAGNTVERPANFGAYAVLEGIGGQGLRYQPRDNAFHQSQAPATR